LNIFLKAQFTLPLHYTAMADQDISADKTPGFKVGEKKTLDEYQKLGMSIPTDPGAYLAECLSNPEFYGQGSQ